MSNEEKTIHAEALDNIGNMLKEDGVVDYERRYLYYILITDLYNKSFAKGLYQGADIVKSANSK